MPTNPLEDIKYKLRRLGEVNNQLVKGLKSFGDPQKLMQRLGALELEVKKGSKQTFRQKMLNEAAWNVPRFYSIRFDFSDGDTAEQTENVVIDQEGWFFCDRIFATWLSTNNDGSDGRFIPISSGDPTITATAGAGYSYPDSLIDFYWEYQEGRSQRTRQNLPLPSDILFRHDLDGFPPEGDAFGPNTTVSFTITPTRALGIDGTLQIILAGVQTLKVLKQ